MCNKTESLRDIFCTDFPPCEKSYIRDMPKYIKNIVTLIGTIMVASFLVFLYNCIIGLSSFAARINPTLEPWLFWTLFVSVAGSLAWVAASMFLRPRPLLVYASPSEQDMARFQQQLIKRLSKNKHLREAKIKVENEKDLEPALDALEVKADEEIKAAAKRVFIGSAIAQNGRLDTLVVLFLITRMAWRISKLYNQRPHPREMVNLYANIAVTSFIAGSVEDLGIDDYVAELMAPLLGGSALGAVPGAQAIAGTITQSILTGSTNSLLALRCGIVARNYMSLKLDESGTMEASKIFVTMSGETVTYVTKLLVKGASNAMRKSTGKVAKGVGNAVSGTAESMSNGAKSAGRSVKQSAGSIVTGVTSGVSHVTNATRQAAGGVGTVGKMSIKKVNAAVNDVKRALPRETAKITQTAKKISTKAVGAITNTENSMRKKTQKITERAGTFFRKGKKQFHSIAKRFNHTK